MKNKKQAEKQEAKNQLLKFLKDGSTLYTSLKSVSRSGMSRRIEVYAVADGEIIRLSYSAAVLLEWSLNDNGILVTGCGMDMGYHLVDCLNHALGIKLNQRWI